MPKMIFFIIKHNNVVIIFMIAVTSHTPAALTPAPDWQCQSYSYSLRMPCAAFTVAFIRLVCLLWACGLWGFEHA